MGSMKKKNKNKKKVSFRDKLDQKIDLLLESLVPAVIIMVPLIFTLYVLNIHGYLFPVEPVVFRLDIFYRYLMYILGGIYLYKLIFRKVTITKSDIPLYVFMIFTILSTIFAYNTKIALYGYPNRYEGMYTLLFYCFLYLDCKLLPERTNIKALLRMLIVVSVIHFVVVILQLTGLYQKLIYMYTSNDAIGLTENCNFLGSLMCLISIIGVCGYLLYSKKDHYKYFLFIFIISYATLLLANSSGPFLSFIFTFILLIIALLIKKLVNVKKIIVSLLIIVIMYPVCLHKRDDITPEIRSNIQTILNRVFGDSSSNKLDETVDDNLEIRNLGHGRIRIWSNVLKLIENKPLLGYGPDNLGLVYEMSVDDNKIADKAHNIYLHIFVSSGVFALLGYLLWLGYTIYLGLKSKDNTILVLCFGIIAYSIQGIFNINVIEVTPYFYIVAGFMMYLIQEKPIFNKN